MQHEEKKRVLIVDNDERIQSTFQEALENSGFDTQTTWSGCEALVLLKANRFDVLLVDDYLADLHASDFLSRVGRLPVQPWIVVMQDSTPTTSDLRAYASLGAFAVVHKGDKAEVCNTVSSCCVDEPLMKAHVN